jgi:transcriptional regulator with XRE-family HTH domain
MSTNSSIGERVRTLRLARNLAQSDLALRLSDGASKANAYVSKVESGRQPLDDAQVAALAEALGCTSEFLMRKPLEAVATRPWLRAYADAPAKTVESIVTDNVLVNEVVTYLDFKRIPERIPVFDGDPNDDAAIERFAEEVRAAAEVPEDGVVGNAMRAADRLGCIVLPLASELGRHLGLSQRINGTPFIRVSRPGAGGVPGDRQRFTVAHEIGHLGLHASVGPPETTDDARLIERQAHRFASSFIAPADPLISDWQDLGGRVTLSTLADLKATWGLSIKALVVRFQQLGIISADQATALYKQISKRGWNTAEPVETTNEEPIWLRKAMTHRTGTSGVGAASRAVAELCGLSEVYLLPWVDWSPLSDPADVVDLPTQRKDGLSNETLVSGGQVIAFPRSHR